VDHDCRRVAFGVEAPDALEESVPAEDQAGMLGQEDEELEFAVGQGDFFSFDVDPVLIDINFQVAAADDFAIGRFLLGLAHEPFIACDVGLDAGYELCRAEGFDDVVVGTEAQAAYLVHVFPLADTIRMGTSFSSRMRRQM